VVGVELGAPKAGAPPGCATPAVQCLFFRTDSQLYGYLDSLLPDRTEISISH
jgi:hypothetical protein